MADMEADRFENLKYTEEAFRTEALAILGEYNKSATSPFLLLEERMRDTAFARHTYKHTTIGFLADVKAMPGYYEYSLQFHERFYRPENCVLILVGDVRPQEVFDLAQRHYADWKTGYRPTDIQAEPPQSEAKTGHVDWPSPVQPLYYAGYHMPAYSDRTVDSATLEVIAQLLFAESSPLYQELVVDKQWVDLIQGSADNHRDPYLFTVVARVKSVDLVPRVEEAIDRAIAELRAKPVPAQKLTRIVSHLRNSFTLGLSTPGAVATQVAALLALTGDVGSLDRTLAQLPRVTPADVQRLARAVFQPTNRTVVTLTGPNAQPPAGAGKPQGGAPHADHQ
jgi:zinc protease